MIEIGARLSELERLGLGRKMRLVSGPQGPRVVLDGKPTLILCSGNYLGLADNPRLREAAAAAAKRWGVGAGGSRVGSGTMTIHRRLEERLAAFTGRRSSLLFGSGFLAGAGVVAALARPGDVVFADEFGHAAIADGCRLSGAETFVYDHLDVDHLAWGISRAEGRGALIATESIFGVSGELAPVEDIVELARRRRIRILVDESHALGAVGPAGRGVLAQAGLEGQVDILLGTLGNAIGSYGAFVACEEEMTDYLLNAARTLIFSGAPAPPAAAAALAALDVLEERPELTARAQANARALRGELRRHGFDVGRSAAPIVLIETGDPDVSERLCDAALARGVFVEAIRPPVVPAGASGVRLTVMASHRRDELRDAVGALSEAAREVGFDPRAATAEAQFGASDPEPEIGTSGAPGATIFDVEQAEPLAA